MTYRKYYIKYIKSLTNISKIFKDKSLGIKQEAFAKPSKPLSVELDCKKYKNLNLQGDSPGINTQRDIPKEFQQE